MMAASPAAAAALSAAAPPAAALAAAPAAKAAEVRAFLPGMVLLLGTWGIHGSLMNDRDNK